MHRLWTRQLIAASLKKEIYFRGVRNVSTPTRVLKIDGKERKVEVDANLSRPDQLEELVEIVAQNNEDLEKKVDARFNSLNERIGKIKQKQDSESQQPTSVGAAIARLSETNRTTSDVDEKHDSLFEETKMPPPIKSGLEDVTIRPPLFATQNDGKISLDIIPGCVPIPERFWQQFLTSTIIVDYVIPKKYRFDMNTRPPTLKEHYGTGAKGKRRRFLDRLAHLCDIEVGGATVTAIGLQQIQTGIILHVASKRGQAFVKNQGIPGADDQQFTNHH